MENLPLFIYVKYSLDGKEKIAHIQTHDTKMRQDAKIGDFDENWYIRPKKCMQYKEYKTLRAYKIACSNALRHYIKGAKIVGYYEKIDVDGVEYEKAI